MKNKLKWLLIAFLSFSCILLLNKPAYAGVSGIGMGFNLSRIFNDIYEISPKYYYYLVSYMVIFLLSYSITKGELKAAFGLSLFVSTITLLVRAGITVLFDF